MPSLFIPKGDVMRILGEQICKTLAQRKAPHTPPTGRWVLVLLAIFIAPTCGAPTYPILHPTSGSSALSFLHASASESQTVGRKHKRCQSLTLGSSC